MKLEDFKSMVREIVREEIEKAVTEQAKLWWQAPAEAELDAHLEPSSVHEKSVPQPYDRTKARKMTKSQIDLRKQIGTAMMRSEKTKSKFRKKYGDEWKDYLWAAASSTAFRRAGSSKSDDSKEE